MTAAAIRAECRGQGAEVGYRWFAQKNHKPMYAFGYGESVRVTVSADRGLLARFDRKKQQWRIDDGTYAVALSRAADAPVATAETKLGGRVFGR